MAAVRRTLRHSRSRRATDRARPAGSPPSPAKQRRLGTVGRPLPYHDLAIVDADGRRLPAGETGQVEVGGFAGHAYRYLAEDGSVEANSHGRIRTGDLGMLDPDGFLSLTGREKELIIRGGVNISPLEIDSFLMQRPELIEVATVGVPDATYGEEVVSYVVARPGTTIDTGELLRFCSDGLPAFKAPKQIVVSASLPKTERGKLDRKVRSVEAAVIASNRPRRDTASSRLGNCPATRFKIRGQRRTTAQGAAMLRQQVEVPPGCAAMRPLRNAVMVTRAPPSCKHAMDRRTSSCPALSRSPTVPSLPANAPSRACASGRSRCPSW